MHVYSCACRHAYRRMCGCVCRVLPLPTRPRSAALPNNCSVLLQLNFHTIGRHWFPRTKGAKDKVNTAAPPSASPAAGSATASAPAAARTATGAPAAAAPIPFVFASPFQPLQQHPTMPQPSPSMPQPPISIVGGTIIGGAPEQQKTSKRRNGVQGVDTTKRTKKRCGTCLENNYCSCSKTKQKTCDSEYPYKGNNSGCASRPCEFF